MNTINRRETKVVKIGGLKIGGKNPIAIQSMVKVKTSCAYSVLKQINDLGNIGCEIIRLAIKDNKDAQVLKVIKQKTSLPIVADIHFDWRLAIKAIENGADKIRLNPGNIYKKQQIKEVALAAKSSAIPIRVGVNSGSLKSGGRGQGAGERKRNLKSVADRMVKSALDYIRMLEGFGFYDIAVSLKASNIFDTIEAYRKMANLCDYPFHLGVTATGLPFSGIAKSSVAIGSLLLEGIGDTIRVSLTDKPQEEVKAARCILETLNLRKFGPEIISCPTCGRCEVDLVKLVKDLECLLSGQRVSGSADLTGKPANRQTGKPIRVAVMGCVVNGPGEAKEADIGVAFGRQEGLLFKKGKPVRKVSFGNCVSELLEEITSFKNINSLTN